MMDDKNPKQERKFTKNRRESLGEFWAEFLGEIGRFREFACKKQHTTQTVKGRFHLQFK
jgi:hypothetical protein